jgi:hypothetical protein
LPAALSPARKQLDRLTPVARRRRRRMRRGSDAPGRGGRPRTRRRGEEREAAAVEVDDDGAAASGEPEGEKCTLRIVVCRLCDGCHPSSMKVTSHGRTYTSTPLLSQTMRSLVSHTGRSSPTTYIEMRGKLAQKPYKHLRRWSATWARKHNFCCTCCWLAI